MQKQPLHDFFDTLERIEVPVIAAVHGVCACGGLELAMACDFRVADATARIGIPAARLSIVYGVRSTQRLLALVGLQAAKRILFSAERLEAEEGHRLGFVDRIGHDALVEIDGEHAFHDAADIHRQLHLARPRPIVQRAGGKANQRVFRGNEHAEKRKQRCRAQEFSGPTP